MKHVTVHRWIRALTVLWLSSIAFAIESAGSQAQSTPDIQGVFVGDVTCADLATDCSHDRVVPAHRYLHVIVHDVAGNADWQVQAGVTCGETGSTIMQGVPVGSDGYLEQVLDITTVALSGASPFGRPTCFVFRGRNHWAVTFYAAYFDDNPSPDGDQVYPVYRDLHGQPDLPDLDVMYIHRNPSFAYDGRPATPSTGQMVTYEAHVQNAGSRPVQPFHYAWLLDGRAVMSGDESGPLAPRQQTVVSLRIAWRDGPHTLQLETFPLGPEVSAANDSLTIRTNALSLGFWIEQAAYDYFQVHQWRYCETLPCATSNSFSDWLERQVDSWNHIMQTATYPGLASNGIIDRIRVDEIVVVPDGALPLHGGRATNSPDTSDHSVDLQWGLPAAGVDRAYRRLWEGPFDVDWALIHELGHARSLADLYRFDVPLRDGTAFRVTAADGRLAFNAANQAGPANEIQPFTMADEETFLYQDQERDLMSCYCNPYFSAYDAVVLNRIQGRRARCGNFNPPCNLGDWYADIPPVNRIRMLDERGRPVPDVSALHLYFDTGTSYADHAFDDQHQLVLHPRHGSVTLPADPFHARGSTWQAGHNLLLLEIRADGKDQFCFQEPTDMNLAYWTGYRDAVHPAVYTLKIGDQRANGCNLLLPPARVNEPFATSAYASTVRASPSVTRRHVRVRRYSMRIVDTSVPPRPMRGRRLDLVDAGGKITASGVTDQQGRLELWAPTAARVDHADDVTDNHLHLSLSAVNTPRP